MDQSTSGREAKDPSSCQRRKAESREDGLSGEPADGGRSSMRPPASSPEGITAAASRISPRRRASPTAHLSLLPQQRGLLLPSSMRRGASSWIACPGAEPARQRGISSGRSPAFSWKDSVRTPTLRSCVEVIRTPSSGGDTLRRIGEAFRCWRHRGGGKRQGDFRPELDSRLACSIFYGPLTRSSPIGSSASARPRGRRGARLHMMDAVILQAWGRAKAGETAP